jgi:Mrp family chromosome partitioning ATPase
VVRDGTLVFALVLGGFIAYALGAPATYRATAVVAVEPVVPVELPPTVEGIQRLRRAALDPELVATLAKEERAVPETAAQVGTRIANTLSIESADGRRFSFAATASGAERSQRVANAFAELAAKRAAQVLDVQPKVEEDPGARAKAALLDFLTAHPGIASEPSPEPTRPERDPLLLALKAERTRIEAKLANPQAAASENPYDEPSLLENPDLLRRRLKEIDSALEARTKPPAPTSSAQSSSQPTPEVRAEWQRLLKAASETKSLEPTPTPAPRLRVTLARAAEPRLPIDPDRPRLVLLGVLISSVAGVLAGLLRGSLEARAVRLYGTTTGAHRINPLPQTTLRIPREELPKAILPRSDPPAALAATVQKQPPLITPIPTAALVPHPITPIPPAPVVPQPITPIPPAPVVPQPITKIPPAPAVAAPITPIPPAPATEKTVPETPIPPAGVAPPATTNSTNATGASPMVIAGPGPVPEHDGPPTTQAYSEPEQPRSRRGSKRRTTKIWGTPPPPELEEQAKNLRTTQAYGSPPVPVRKERPEVLPFSPTPIPAEVLPPHRSSLRPTPMVPVTSSSVPPAVTPSNRSGAPLAETGYSYVRTPVPAAHSIPQTPYPRRPSPPPHTEPYGSIPPVQPRKPPSDPPAVDPSKVKTPLPPEPEPAKPARVIRTHPVHAGWAPEKKIAPGLRRDVAGEILTLAVERCHIIGITGIRGMGNEKSRAAVEIAFALSEAKHPRILLVEGDFHFPQLQNWLKLDVPLSAGFSQQLRGRIQGNKEGRWHVVECQKSLHVLAEGVMRSPGLLLSNQFEEAMRELRSYYDIIIIDAPLAPNEADSRALGDVVDGAVILGSKERASEIAEVGRIFSGKKLVRFLET